MNTADLITMLSNLSRSLLPVESLLGGISYLLGIGFFMTGIFKLKKMAESGSHSSSNEHAFVPLAYLVGASALFFLPTAMTTLSNTFFGSGNVLQYSTYNSYNIINSIKFLVKVAGIIWFIRGCVLLVHSSEPGVQHGPKGLTFLIAGIIAINLDNTIAFLTWIMSNIADWTLSIKTSRGY